MTVIVLLNELRKTTGSFSCEFYMKKLSLIDFAILLHQQFRVPLNITNTTDENHT